MSEIRFTTPLPKDGWIKIPAKQLLRVKRGKAKKLNIVISAQEESSKPEFDMIEYLIENPVEFDGPFLTRDEIYDRKRVP